VRALASERSWNDWEDRYDDAYYRPLKTLFERLLAAGDVSRMRSRWSCRAASLRSVAAATGPRQNFRATGLLRDWWMCLANRVAPG
jgi:hypothetical protein